MELAERYDERYSSYVDLNTNTRAITHRFAARQERWWLRRQTTQQKP